LRNNIKSNEVGRLILRFPAVDSQPVLWLLDLPDAPRQGSTAFGETDPEFTGMLSTYPTWVLVPASEIAFHEVTLPHCMRHQRLQVLPFMLEELLVTEIEYLHFAILRQRGNVFDVAVVEKKLMQKWVAHCDQLGVREQLFMPDVLMLPLATEGWSAVRLNDQWLFRRDSFAGMAVESSWLAELLALSPPPLIESYSTPPTETMGVEWRMKPERGLLQLAAENEGYSGADLRQGEFTRPGNWRAGVRPWRSLILALATYILLVAIDMGVAHYRLWQEAEHWQQESVRFYQQLFPGERNVSNPRVQMMKHLQQLESGEQASLHEKIRQLQQLLTEESAIRIQGLSWDGNRQELKVNLQAPSFQGVEQFQQSAGKFFQVQPGEVRQSPNGVESRVILGIIHE
jgi:general secretion pathway protein L